MRQHTPEDGGFSRSPIAPAKSDKLSLSFWVAVLGVLPTLVTTWVVIYSRLDAGFYMPGDFLDAQRAMTLRVGIYLAIPALVLLWVVVKRTLAAPQFIVARSAQALSLITVLAWLFYAVPMLREHYLVSPMTQAEALAYAETPIDDRLHAAGLLDMSLDDRIFTLRLAPTRLELDAIAIAEITPRLCRNFGRLFAGPVDVVRSEFRAPAGDRYVLDLSWQDCRGWYLQDRAATRRPLDAPRVWDFRHFDWPIFAGPPGIDI